jgi:glycosyltransferase involved in cell wall biosynthesis
MHEQHFKFQEIIVVDDGSRDATAGVVNDYSKPPSPIRLLRNPGNRGKGYAVRHGVLDAGGEWILYTDADLSTPIAEVQKLYSAAIVQKAVIAIGSRAIDRSLVEVHQSVFREYSGRFFNLVMRTLTGLPFHDTQCGFKLYRADAAKEIFPRQEQDGFSFDVEDLVIAKKLGLRAVEVPVRWRNVEGTKVTLVEGLRSFTDLLQIRKDHGP